jgi:hypothetical protein
MQEWMKRWMKERSWRAALNEVRRFLDTWYFSISTDGELYVRPLRRTISGRDIDAFCARLEALEKDGIPAATTFDFAHPPLSERRWRRTVRTLREYAHRIKAVCVVLSGGADRGGVVLIMRSFRQGNAGEGNRSVPEKSPAVAAGPGPYLSGRRVEKGGSLMGPEEIVIQAATDSSIFSNPPDTRNDGANTFS